MAPIQEIQYWLTKKTPYSYGVDLLSQVINNQRLIFNLQRRATPKNLQKVEYELKKFIRDNPKLVENAKEQTTEKEFHSSESEGDDIGSELESSIEPDYIRKTKELSTSSRSNRSNDLASDKHDLVSKVKQERALLYRQRGHFHGRLHESLSETDRFSLAKKIMKLQKEIDQVNADLELIEQGKTPRSILLKIMSAEDYKRYRNCQNYVVRYKNKLDDDKLSEEDRTRYQEKHDQYKSELESFFN